MAAELETEGHLQIGHVLFMDIVGYSKLLLDQQSDYSDRLNQIVRSTSQFRAAEAEGKLIRLPTGDGMALVFFNSPEAPVRCAVEIGKAVKESSDFCLRMGVHSGPVNKTSDVNDRSNLAGGGINIAQRVMDCGDAGHILLSRRVAEDLEQHSKWQPYLQDLGECEVKHGVRVNVVNLCAGEVGNPVIPEKLARAKQKQDALTLAAGEAIAAAASQAAALRRRKSALLAGSVLALLAVGLGVWVFSQRKPATATGIESLAVKPLENLSGDASKDYFADGMTDELTTKLSQINALKRVVSRSTMMKYKRSPKSSAEIAHEIKVGAIVEGSVVLSGNQARISVQLIDAATDKTLWAESYTQDVANIVQIQDQVTLAVASAIALKLTPGEKTRFATARTVNPEAYDYYLRGIHEAGTSLESCDISIGMLEKAISIDNNFAEAYAALANAYQDKHFFFDTNKDLEVKAEQAVAKALQINPELPAAIVTQAGLLLTPSHGFPHEQVIAETRRALAVAPNFGDAHFSLGVVYFHVGLIDEAMAEFKRAEEISPGEGPRFHIGLMELYQGHYSKAVATMQSNFGGMVPSFAQYSISFALFYEGKTEAARDGIDKAKEKFADEGGQMDAVQAFLFASTGDKLHAHQKIEEATKVGEGFGHFHHTTYAIALAYASMHENDQAVKWLKYTAENGFPNLTWFERDPALASLHKDPGFIKLITEMRPRFEKLKAQADSPLTIAAN